MCPVTELRRTVNADVLKLFFSMVGINPRADLRYEQTRMNRVNSKVSVVNENIIYAFRYS